MVDREKVSEKKRERNRGNWSERKRGRKRKKKMCYVYQKSKKRHEPTVHLTTCTCVQHNEYKSKTSHVDEKSSLFVIFML